MKHLKYFETEAAYIAYKNGSDFVLPNISYVEDIDGIMVNPYVEPVEPSSLNVVCTYSVTDISQETQILYYYGLNCFSSMIINGVEMDADAYYQFDTVGNHVVEFVLDDPTSIEYSAFWGCNNLVSITIPDSVTLIGEGAFGECSSIKSFNGKFASEDGRCLIMSDELIAFAPAGLTSYIIPNSVTTIGSGAFTNCSSLKSINIPNSVTTIGNGAFSGCSSLTSVIIPNSVTIIDWNTFSNCTSLTSVTIPNSITEIGGNSFAGCSNLTSITCYAPTAPSIQPFTFRDISNGGILYVPTGSDYSSWMNTSSDYLGYYNWTIQYI